VVPRHTLEVEFNAPLAENMVAFALSLAEAVLHEALKDSAQARLASFSLTSPEGGHVERRFPAPSLRGPNLIARGDQLSADPDLARRARNAFALVHGEVTAPARNTPDLDEPS
jgi:hypothetical protein